MLLSEEILTSLHLSLAPRSVLLVRVTDASLSQNILHFLLLFQAGHWELRVTSIKP